ncbi:interferon regulatory factor 7 isoform X1 [Mauremys reevesii]|uniref:interferon regulatory factor 7 isoform X1 n=1 Tax=Mauremys reevesii TaxID=260615 RepID=UPI00193F9D21|nr:interferon regulatory factor 7 isoform X1 [Mauremys reevesii]
MMAASESEGGSQKLRFAWWLIKQINSKDYEGLCWVDKDHTQFRIPWKHISRKDINPNDYKIFKAWAITSGKYNEKLKDLAKWKTNFRCALRSTNMFLKVQDNSKTSEDPHKVYKIISSSPDAVTAANALTTKNNNLLDSKEDIRPHSEEAPNLHHRMPQQLQPQIELDLEMLSLENPPQEMDSGQNERPAYDLGRNPPQGYTTNHSAPNGYQCSPDTLHWILQQCNLTQNDCSPQQLPWALDGGLDHRSEEVPYEDSPGYLNQHIGQNSYPQQGSGVANGPVENYHQSVGQWVTQTTAETQTMQNAYGPSAASLLQQPLPSSPVPDMSQRLNNAAEVLFEGRPYYNNHAGVQSTFLSEAPAGNAVIYPTLNGPGENSYHQPANQWAAPAVLEQNGFTQPAAPLPEQHPPPNTAPSRNNTETVPPNMDITIYYRGKSLHEVQVATSSCLFTYNNEDPTIVPGCTQVVQFPSPDELPDQKQVQFTRQLLPNIGLLLELKHKKIYAKRLNKCKVFWALSRQLVNMAQNPEPKLLPRGTEMEIFDFEVFSKELKDFKEQRAASPDFTIYLCFGQCFSKTKPKESMLILVKLVPKFCEYFHDMVLREGASSLNSGNVSLQLSSYFNSLYDLIEQFNMEID